MAAKWLDAPEDHEPPVVEKAVASLRTVTLVHRTAKDTDIPCHLVSWPA